MEKKVIYDCVTFFQENLHMELRINILKDVVDKFIVCESIFDHRGNKKKINFSKYNYPGLEHKIDHIIIEERFPKNNNPWKNQAIQREYIFKALDDLKDNDYFMFSDPDEIPNPDSLKNLDLKKNLEYFSKIFTHTSSIF